MLAERAADRGPISTVYPAPEALDRQALLRHLVLLGLAYSKPSGLSQACTRQAQAALDGATGLGTLTFAPPPPIDIIQP